MSEQRWSVETLHEHISAMLQERDRFWLMLLDERTKRNEQRFEFQTSATEKALASAQLAVTKAETAVEKRLENTNEWRAAMNDRDVKLLPRQEFMSILAEWKSWRENTVKVREDLVSRVTAIETRIVTWLAAVGVFFTLVQVAMFWIFKK